MAQAFGEISDATADKTNPHYKSKYASLYAVQHAIKPALVKHKLFWIQIVHDQVDRAAVETVIIHESGEKLACGVLAVPMSKKDAHGYASAMTYARRYSLSAAFGVAPEDEDDDGNAAVAKGNNSKSAYKPPPAPIDVPWADIHAACSKLAELKQLTEPENNDPGWTADGLGKRAKDQIIAGTPASEVLTNLRRAIGTQQKAGAA
jgi:hypothetical protein